jgi:hypothetical protein
MRQTVASKLQARGERRSASCFSLYFLGHVQANPSLPAVDVLPQAPPPPLMRLRAPL